MIAKNSGGVPELIHQIDHEEPLGIVREERPLGPVSGIKKNQPTRMPDRRLQVVPEDRQDPSEPVESTEKTSILASS